MYTIYKRTTPDGKVYIGCTSKSLAARAGIEGAGYRQSPLFWAAILEWGWSRIESAVLSTTDSAEKAKRLETDAISQAVNDCGSDKLLNTELSSSYSWTPEQRAYMAIVLKGSAKFQAACRDDEHRAHISSSLTKKWAEPGYRQDVTTSIKNSLLHKEACSSAENREKRSQSQKNWHQVEENRTRFLETMRSTSRRERLSASIRASESHKASCQSEERNQKLAASLRAHYADENNRQAMSDAVKNSDAFQKAMQSDERRAKIAASSKGRVWIHKEDSNKFVPRSELPSFLEQGWLRGRK